MGNTKTLFSLFTSFQQFTKNTFILTFLRGQYSNRGSLGSEVTALPTEPQPLGTLFVRHTKSSQID